MNNNIGNKPPDQLILKDFRTGLGQRSGAAGQGVGGSVEEQPAKAPAPLASVRSDFDTGAQGVLGNFTFNFGDATVKRNGDAITLKYNGIEYKGIVDSRADGNVGHTIFGKDPKTQQTLFEINWYAPNAGRRNAEVGLRVLTQPNGLQLYPPKIYSPISDE